MSTGTAGVAAARLSVVMPAYNAERFVRAALESVLAEVDADDEVIVVDDGSTDGTRFEAASIDDPRLRILARGHRGDGAATNVGVAASTGELLAFCDADDLWRPGRLAWQRPLVMSGVADAVYGAGHNFRGHGRPDDDRGRPAPMVAAVRGTVLVHRRVWQSVGPMNESHGVGAGFEWWLRVEAAGVTIIRDDRVVLDRRLHGDNIGIVRGDRVRRELPRALAEHLQRRRAAEAGG